MQTWGPEAHIGINTHPLTLKGTCILIPGLFNVLCCVGNLCSYLLSTNPVSLLIYTSLSLSLSLLTPPTRSSVVSYSAHVLILLRRPRILQTLAKFWLYSRSPNAHSLPWVWTQAHTHVFFRLKLNSMESLSEIPFSGWLIDWMAHWIVPCPYAWRH